jgi:hypothetical protein
MTGSLNLDMSNFSSFGELPGLLNANPHAVWTFYAEATLIGLYDSDPRPAAENWEVAPNTDQLTFNMYLQSDPDPNATRFVGTATGQDTGVLAQSYDGQDIRYWLYGSLNGQASFLNISGNGITEQPDVENLIGALTRSGITSRQGHPLSRLR